METMITIKGIAYRTKPKAPMTEIDSVEITCEQGLVPDTRGKPGKRQVTVLSLESWQIACAELEVELPWTTRRANILVSGMQFSAADVGKILQMGDVQLQITIETDPCNRMDEQHQGLTAALTPDWRAGVCCKVLKGGMVRSGAEVCFSSGLSA
jgi:MOSC domain-containing protein YiiM